MKTPMMKKLQKNIEIHKYEIIMTNYTKMVYKKLNYIVQFEDLYIASKLSFFKLDQTK